MERLLRRRSDDLSDSLTVKVEPSLGRDLNRLPPLLGQTNTLLPFCGLLEREDWRLWRRRRARDNFVYMAELLRDSRRASLFLSLPGE